MTDIADEVPDGAHHPAQASVRFFIRGSSARWTRCASRHIEAKAYVMRPLSAEAWRQIRVAAAVAPTGSGFPGIVFAELLDRNPFDRLLPVAGMPRELLMIATDADGTEGGDPDFWSAPCQRCDGPAEHGCYEQIVGSVNITLTVRCDHCGFASGFD